MNIRSSNPNAIQSAALRVAPSSLQEEIHLFLEGRKISEILVSQYIRTLGSFNSKDRIFVSSRFGPVPSAYLILRSGSPTIFWNKKTGSAHIVRIPIQRRDLEKVGSIVLSATYYSNERKMVIEDVLYYNGKNLWTESSFTKRWPVLKNISQTILKPDSASQGFELTIARLESLETWLKRHTYDDVFMWEFTIDKASTRRLLWQPIKPVAKPEVKPEVQPQAKIERQQPQQPTPTHTLKPLQKLIASIEKDTTTTLPDSYILYASDHSQQGSPAVKKLTVSLALRSALTSAQSCKVEVNYNENFKKYEVTEIVDSTSHVAAPESFHKRI
jgi:hypothetical protein